MDESPQQFILQVLRVILTGVFKANILEVMSE